MRKSVIVSNRLPLQISKLENSFLFQPSSGGLATGLDSVHKNNDSIWVGWSGITSDELTKKNKLEIKNTLDDLRLIEVELNQKEVDEFYHGLSNKCIWPLFHYFIELAKFNENDWLTYVDVNKKFCEKSNSKYRTKWCCLGTRLSTYVAPKAHKGAKTRLNNWVFSSYTISFF